MKEQNPELNEPASAYNRITFSSVETQWDIQLRHSLSLSPAERMGVMRQLNEIAFGKKHDDSPKSNRIIFTSYESFL